MSTAFSGNNTSKIVKTQGANTNLPIRPSFYKDFLSIERSGRESVTPFTDTTDRANFKSASTFTIGQLNEAGEIVRTFNFSLLPAIESKLGSNQVPEVKPGIFERVSQNIKTFKIPGSKPTFQVLGLEPTVMQLVGLFTGSESIEDKVDNLVGPNNSKGTIAIYNPKSGLDAYWYANFFREKIAQAGRPVRLTIASTKAGTDTPISIDRNILIQGLRFFYTREDRIYYAMEILVLDYPVTPVPTPTTPTEPSTESETPPVVPDPPIDQSVVPEATIQDVITYLESNNISYIVNKNNLVVISEQNFDANFSPKYANRIVVSNMIPSFIRDFKKIADRFPNQVEVNVNSDFNTSYIHMSQSQYDILDREISGGILTLEALTINNTTRVK